MSELVLASASPQRRQLLEGLGIPFIVDPSSVDEGAHPEGDPVLRSQVLACAKAADVAKRHPTAWVLGCDTLVVAPDGTLLEKPVDADDARRMLRLQSGGVSIVHSALCLMGPKEECIEDISSSTVRFRSLNEEDIEWWIGTDQWRDRSGSFQIDGRGQMLIEHLEGDWTGVVGLPVFLLGKMLRETGML